jgi:hypothetical protein
MYVQTNMGSLCCVGSGSNVAAAQEERIRQGEVRADKQLATAAIAELYARTSLQKFGQSESYEMLPDEKHLLFHNAQ